MKHVYASQLAPLGDENNKEHCPVFDEDKPEPLRHLSQDGWTYDPEDDVWTFWINPLWVEIGRFSDDQYIYVGISGNLATLFDEERKFIKVDNAKKYVENTLRKWMQETTSLIDNTQAYYGRTR